MAKENIPFDFFFERYYPERSFHCHGALDLPENYTNQQYAAAMNAFFDVIFAVTLEDIQSLTDEELNCVPTPWLYDWLHCHMGEGEEFIEELREKREAYKKTIPYDQLRKVREYMKEHDKFTSHEVQEDLSFSYEGFLAVTYNLIIRGHIRYQDGVYYAIKEAL